MGYLIWKSESETPPGDEVEARLTPTEVYIFIYAHLCVYVPDPNFSHTHAHTFREIVVIG